MSNDEELVSFPRPASLPNIVEAVEPSPIVSVAETPPRKRSEVVAAGALFVALLGVLTVAVGVVRFAIF